MTAPSGSVPETYDCFCGHPADEHALGGEQECVSCDCTDYEMEPVVADVSGSVPEPAERQCTRCQIGTHRADGNWPGGLAWCDSCECGVDDYCPTEPKENTVSEIKPDAGGKPDRSWAKAWAMYPATTAETVGYEQLAAVGFDPDLGDYIRAYHDDANGNEHDGVSALCTVCDPELVSRG